VIVPVSGGPTVPPGPDYEGQVFTLVNEERAKAGCPAVTPDARLVTAARAHSVDMANRHYFEHSTPNGVTAGTRISDAGYRWSAYGENIAEGYPDAVSVMKGWMASPGHRKNILNCRLRNLGVGLAYAADHQSYWTQDFATPL